MKPFFKDTGRGILGRPLGNGFFVLFPWFWPWSKIEFYEDKILLQIWPKIIQIPLNKIESIKVGRGYGLKGPLRINHSINEIPRGVYFSSYNNEKIIELFQEKKVKVEYQISK